ncbi:hypothetical protein M409DRAFT_26181 [Zasmidium cellare ATCC 36951]|uniref:Zn(2)-C6 fungal-type domain-containing protein n=1 Tax=Zasmidium cellare ATCC 36951 TaxID=1080233 RepID=A0A6A6C956_ZASCE|nr:uncharacterized protein M409DRAFT_26181 [Zasmidium cellare ATCC 36951]KAF2163571.1 hypothetical protein M409DRAFT_26181 [Zasmidium cellare ATCC 36951]
MPLRSNGCYKCRSRKIRCDLTRPGCQRCAIHGVKCPGYRTENPGDIEFRDQTGLVWQRAKDNDDLKTGHVSKPLDLSHDPSPGSSSSEDSLISAHQNQLGRLQSPAANRAQLYSAFMDTYIPQNFLPEESVFKDAHFGWLGMAVSISEPKPALKHALDAISLVQMGSMLNDEQLLRKSVESYTLGLRSLAHALSNPKNVYADDIMAASSVLCQCEMYNEIKQHGQGWLGHLQGLQKIITARGPRALNSQLARMLFYQSTRTSLASSLLSRKTSYYSAPKWLAAQVKVDLHEDYSDSYRSGQQIPGLLERCDNLDVDSPHIMDDIEDLLYDCETLLSGMKAEVAMLSSRTVKNGKACFTLADITNFTAFTTLVQDRTLDRAYWFSSYLNCYLYSQYWLRMFLLRGCTQQVHSLRQQVVPGWNPEKEAAVSETEVLGYVMNLCRCIPYLVEPSNCTIGCICSFFPVHIATQYFRDHGHWQWVEWARCVRNAIFSKGFSIPVNYDDGPYGDRITERDQDIERRFNWIDDNSNCMPSGPFRYASSEAT